MLTRFAVFVLAFVFSLAMLFVAVGVIVKSAEFFGVRAVMVVQER